MRPFDIRDLLIVMGSIGPGCGVSWCSKHLAEVTALSMAVDKFLKYHFWRSDKLRVLFRERARRTIDLRCVDVGND